MDRACAHENLLSKYIAGLFTKRKKSVILESLSHNEQYIIKTPAHVCFFIFKIRLYPLINDKLLQETGSSYI